MGALPRFGGFVDTLAFLLIAASFLMPVIFPQIGYFYTIVLALYGVGWIGFRISNNIRKGAVFDSPVSVRSSSKLPTKDAENSFLLGYRVTDGQPVYIPDELLMRHLSITGQSGVGKTVMLKLLMFQQIARGGGLTFIDGKMTDDDLLFVWQMCCWCGRENDLRIISPGDPDNSHTYNPILFGDADEIADRPISTIPANDSNPGTDYYRKAAHQGLVTIVSALQKVNLAYGFIDIAVLLMNARAMSNLEQKLVAEYPESDECKAFSLFLDQFRGTAVGGNENMIDIKRMKEIFGGIGQRMFLLGAGKFGRALNSYTPDVQLYDDIMSNRIIYVQLPTMGKNEASSNFAKMFIGDFRTCVSWMQGLTDDKKLKIPHLAAMDEVGSYAVMSMSRMFEQARSARVALVPAMQTAANLVSVSEEFYEMVTGNTWTKVYFKIGTQDTANKIAEFAGERKVMLRQVSEARSFGSSSQSLRIDPAGSQTEGSGETISWREDKELRVSGEDLKGLAIGEAIVIYGGDQVHHIKIPNIFFNKELIEDFGKPAIRRRWHSEVKGVNYFRDAAKWLARRATGDMSDGNKQIPREKSK